jgi:hypothetical protein
MGSTPPQGSQVATGMSEKADLLRARYGTPYQGLSNPRTPPAAVFPIVTEAPPRAGTRLPPFWAFNRSVSAQCS